MLRNVKILFLNLGAPKRQRAKWEEPELSILLMGVITDLTCPMEGILLEVAHGIP